jgi:hypothetical protein
MVAEVRAGVSMRAVARLHQVSLFTVQWRVRRAGDLSLEDVDWSYRSPLPARSGRTEPGPGRAETAFFMRTSQTRTLRIFDQGGSDSSAVICGKSHQVVL